MSTNRAANNCYANQLIPVTCPDAKPMPYSRFVMTVIRQDKSISLLQFYRYCTHFLPSVVAIE